MAENNDKEVQEAIQDRNSVDWQQGKALDACLVEMFDRCLWTDVKFRCKDHEESGFIEAHKNVLAARSSVFQAMFFGPCADGKNEVDVNTTQSETLRLFLRYLYCDIITLTEETAFAVVELAHFYQISSLVQHCAVYLSTVITSSNVYRILTFAMLYELTSLKTLCCSFIDTHAEEVLKSDAFMELSAENLLYVLKGDTLHAEESVILDAAVIWSRKKVIEKGIEATGPNIRTCLGESFYQLRLPTMTSNSLMECISRKGYFSVEEYADIAAFIGKVPGISVSTNSCVPRVPEKESIIVNIEDGNDLTIDRVSSLFEISITKDVALSGIFLCEMKPYLKCMKEMYTDENCLVQNERSPSLQISDYMDTVIKITRGSYYRHGNYVTVLKDLEGVDLPTHTELALSGSVVVTCLDFRHNFIVQQSLSENGNISFEPPLELKKKNSPYRVEMDVQYKCKKGVQIKTKDTCKRESQSVNGHIQIHSISGRFAGLESIEFQNYSNREICVDTASADTGKH